MKFYWIRLSTQFTRNSWLVGRRPLRCTCSSKNPTISYSKKWSRISWLRRNTMPCANYTSVQVPWRSSLTCGPSMLRTFQVGPRVKLVFLKTGLRTANGVTTISQIPSRICSSFWRSTEIDSWFRSGLFGSRLRILHER